MNNTLVNFVGWLLALMVFLVFGMVAGACSTYPWVTGKLGEAQLRQAEQNRKIAVQEAQARLESAKFDSQANRIIGDSLKDNDGYLQYLWINGLHDGSSETIYIPTEANLPILEAGRFSGRGARAPTEAEDE